MADDYQASRAGHKMTGIVHCFDIGGSAIRSAVARSAEDIRVTGRVATPLDDFEAFADALGAMVAGHEDAMGSRRAAHAAVALSITGVVDPQDGRIACANIPCIDGRSLARDLSARLGSAVHVANDADCFALAEARLGAGRGHDIVFGVILGTGVGGGIVIGGRLLRGAGGIAGEWGHGPVAATHAGAPPVPVPLFACGCGQRGCVDTIGGARGLERLHRHLHGRDLHSTAITGAWTASDAAAARTIDCWLDLVSGPLAMAVNLLGASVVPVGGGLSGLPALMARLDAAVRARILRRGAAPLVVPGTCRIEPGLIGAALLGFAS